MTQILELTFWEVPTPSSFLSPSLRVDVHEFEQLSQPCPAPAPFSLTGVLSARSLGNSISPWCLFLWGPSYTTDLRNLNLWTDALVMILRLWCSWHLQVLWEHRLLGLPETFWHWICMSNNFPGDPDVTGATLWEPLDYVSLPLAPGQQDDQGAHQWYFQMWLYGFQTMSWRNLMLGDLL